MMINDSKNKTDMRVRDFLALKMEINSKAYPADVQKLGKLGYDVKRLNRNIQFRIENILDIYPKNRKYHDIKLNKRGCYTSIEELINKVLTHH